MTMKISPSGQLIVFVAAGLSLLSFLLGATIAGGAFAVVFAVSVFVFRSTVRDLKCRSADMIAPIEGRIAGFSDYYVDQKLKRRWQRIDIQRSPFGPWMLYSPLEGQIVDAWFQDNPEHGCLELVIQMRSSVQEDFLLVLIANPILNYFDSSRIQPGEILGKGGDLGFCSLAKVSICVPSNWVPGIKVASRIHARYDTLFHVGK